MSTDTASYEIGGRPFSNTRLLSTSRPTASSWIKRCPANVHKGLRST